MTDIFVPSKELYLVGYFVNKDKRPDFTTEAFRFELPQGKPITIGRRMQDFTPDIEIDDPHISRVHATMYAPVETLRRIEKLDYALYTHLGRNKPERIVLSPQRKDLSSTSLLLGKLETHSRKTHLKMGETVELYPQDMIQYGAIAIQLKTSN